VQIIRGGGALRTVAALGLGAIAIFAGGCAKQEADTNAAGPPPVPVIVSKVAEKTVPVQLEAIGNVEAYSTVSIKPQVSGPLMKVHFQEGEDVRKGQLLFTIDPRPFQAALAQAEAALAKDAAVAENDRVSAKRYLDLFQQGVAARQQSDDYASAAKAQDAQVRADQAAIDTAKLNLEYCSIYSPVDGRTGSLQVHEGNLVKGNDVPILVVINQIQPILVNFAIPEDQLAEVKKYRGTGQLRVEGLIPNDSGGSEQGTLSFIDNSVDAATGTIHLKAVFANPRRRLWPGQFVNVVLTLTSSPNTVVVPAQAVASGQNGNYVFVVKSDNTVESRPIVTGKTIQGNTVVQKGLRLGEVVVVDGQVRLAPGAPVSIKQAPAPPNSAPTGVASTPGG
jgi:multidrug efflux system membrane fusion protein